MSDETQDFTNLAYLLETLTVVECRKAQANACPPSSARPPGSRGVVGADVHACYLPYETLAANAADSAREALGDDAHADALDTGQALDLGGILDLALEQV